MRSQRYLLVPLFAAAGCIALAANPVWVTPDVPTAEGLGGTNLLPWEIYRYDGVSYTPVLSVPGNPDLNGIHKLDLPGDWLFSVEAPSDLGGFLQPAGTIAEPRDVIRYDSTANVYTICMSGAVAGIPPGSNVDAVYMDGGDQGDMIVSFDVPTDIPPFAGPTAFEPADLIRFGPLGPGICPGAGFALLAANPYFDASTAGPGVPPSSITDGGDGPASKVVLAFDVPTDIPPFVGPAAFRPGQLVEWDGILLTYSVFENLIGWPISSIVDGVSCGGAPGRVTPTTLTVDKAAAPPGDIVINWPGSCASGAQDYGIYEGTIGTYYSHTLFTCTDTFPLFTEQITPSAGSRYYLVVPHNICGSVEGSYGRCSPGKCLAGNERNVGAAVCQPVQVIPTPPACP